MSQKQDILGRLREKKKQVQVLVKPSVKKAPAPKPPPRLDDHTPPNGVSPSFDLRPVVSQQQISEERGTPQSPVKSVTKSVSKGLYYYNISLIITITVFITSYFLI